MRNCAAKEFRFSSPRIYLEEAERLCDRVAIIHQGKIRAEGATLGLIEQWSRKKIRLHLTTPVDGFRHPDLVAGSGTDFTFVVPMSKPLGVLLQELELRIENLKDIKVQEGNLEDVFLQLTRSGTDGV